MNKGVQTILLSNNEQSLPISSNNMTAVTFEADAEASVGSTADGDKGMGHCRSIENITQDELGRLSIMNGGHPDITFPSGVKSAAIGGHDWLRRDVPESNEILPARIKVVTSSGVEETHESG